MKRAFLLPCFILLAGLLSAQTHFYISEIVVQPAVPSTSDNVSIQLIGDLSDTGAFIASAEVEVTGNSVSITLLASSNGGATVLVPHTEVLSLGVLPAGDYIIDLSSASAGVSDFAPAPQHNFTVSGSNPCAGLELVSLQWQAFSDTAVMVHVTNSSSEVFSYPGFILLDAQGDTLAKETVDLFSIGSESWHMLRIQDGVTMPEEAFNGRLELWTNFTDTLACVWEEEFSLCPSVQCSDLEIHLVNSIGPDVIGIYNWALYDAFGNVDSGQLALSAEEQSVSTTVCIPPGEYFLNIDPTDFGSTDAPRYHASIAGGQVTESGWATSSLPVNVNFTLYGPCISGTQSIAEHSAPSLITRNSYDGVFVETSDGNRLGEVSLYDAGGRLQFSKKTDDVQLFVPLDSSGLYLLRAGERVVKVLRAER